MSGIILATPPVDFMVHNSTRRSGRG